MARGENTGFRVPHRHPPAGEATHHLQAGRVTPGEARLHNRGSLHYAGGGARPSCHPNAALSGQRTGPALPRSMSLKGCEPPSSPPDVLHPQLGRCGGVCKAGQDGLQRQRLHQAVAVAVHVREPSPNCQVEQQVHWLRVREVGWGGCRESRGACRPELGGNGWVCWALHVACGGFPAQIITAH